MTQQLFPKETIAPALGRIPSGVFVVTALDGDRPVGMLASWVQQVGFEPPTLTVAVHPERELYQPLEQSGRFTVNILSNQNMNLMRNFSRYNPDQFEGVQIEETDYGVTLTEAVATLHCRVIQKLAVADHHLFVAEIMNGALLSETTEPMVHIRKSGFNY